MSIFHCKFEDLNIFRYSLSDIAHSSNSSKSRKRRCPDEGNSRNKISDFDSRTEEGFFIIILFNVVYKNGRNSLKLIAHFIKNIIFHIGKWKSNIPISLVNNSIRIRIFNLNICVEGN
jgi:hypothetical protein